MAGPLCPCKGISTPPDNHFLDMSHPPITPESLISFEPIYPFRKVCATTCTHTECRWKTALLDFPYTEELCCIHGAALGDATEASGVFNGYQVVKNL